MDSGVVAEEGAFGDAPKGERVRQARLEVQSKRSVEGGSGTCARASAIFICGGPAASRLREPCALKPRLTVVAVPARDEAARIGTCLRALAGQRDLRGAPLDTAAVRVVVYSNNSRDGTPEIAERALPGALVIRAELKPPHANAGAARRGAMEAGLRLLDTRDGVICTTDADSRPRPDWIARLWAALDGGAEAVAGAIDFDPQEGARPRVSPGRRREADYAAAQAELVARLDPETYNPWPNHLWAWGANLAVTADAYRRAGGLPPVGLAEDRAFVERLRLFDIPVRHCLQARVWTSPRARGRAPGGLADLVADHVGPDRAPCDHALEPAFAAARRAIWRRRLRLAREEGATNPGWARRLCAPEAAVEQALTQLRFGEGWQALERASPRLRRIRLRVDDLPRELARAERLLRRLRLGEADPADSVRAAASSPWSAASPPG